MKLWHDDVRPPPGALEGGSDWTWARTNEEAMSALSTGEVTEASLDHDLGYSGPPPGPCESCGRTGVGDDGLPCGPCDGDGFIGGDVLYIARTAEETGLDLVKWMVRTDNVPIVVTIHSWNPDGARNMAKALWDAGYGTGVTIRPYEVPPRDSRL